MYEAGNLLDEFNSCPGYWGNDEIDEQPLEADVATLAKYCRPATDIEELQEILVQDSRANTAAGRMPAFTFAEERLTRLAPLVGLREDVVLSDFGSINLEIAADDISAQWVGAGQQPEHRVDFEEESDEQLRFSLPKAPLHEAAQRDDLATIEQLVAGGTDVNEIPGGYEVTALAMAAAYGTPPTIRRLVELGADLHKKAREGAPPIRFAAQAAKIENLRVLAELGGDVADYNPQLGTLLHLAATMQSPPDVVRALLEIGVDAGRKNEAGLKAIDIVRGNIGSFEAIRSMLQQTGDKADAENQQRLDEHRRRLDEVEQILSRWTT